MDKKGYIVLCRIANSRCMSPKVDKEQQQAFDIVYVTSQFEKTKLDIKVCLIRRRKFLVYGLCHVKSKDD